MSNETWPGCVQVFWTEEERQSLRDITAETLAMLKDHRNGILQAKAAGGDMESAVKLANEHGETATLESIVMHGNKETVAALAVYLADEYRIQTYFKIRENDPALANRLLCHAADEGFCEACKLVGGIHFAGDGVPKSVEKAYVW